VVLAICKNCKHFVRNSKKVPVFAFGCFGWWIVVPNGGKCLLKKGGQPYKAMTDSCADWESKEEDC